MEVKFYVCPHCGNVIIKLTDAQVPVVCCGQRMEEIIPGTTDASAEKHVPQWTVQGDIVTVKVGSVEHPMLEAHNISWIFLQTTQGWQYKALKPEDRPEAVFALAPGDSVEAVYAYCNLHSLWKS